MWSGRIRRGSLYDGVIMDPPSYGRGPGGEVWKLEDSVYDLVKLCAGVLTENPLFFAINSYTTGLSPSVMEYILNTTVSRRFAGKGTTFSSENRAAGKGHRLPPALRLHRRVAQQGVKKGQGGPQAARPLGGQADRRSASAALPPGLRPGCQPPAEAGQEPLPCRTA